MWYSVCQAQPFCPSDGCPFVLASQDAAHRKVDQLRQEYLEMKALIDASEASATRKIKEEEKRVISKFDNIYQIILKKRSEIQTLKEEVELALTKGDEFEFLEVGHDEHVVESFFCLELQCGAGLSRGWGGKRFWDASLRHTGCISFLRFVTTYCKLRGLEEKLSVTSHSVWLRLWSH